MKQSEYKDTVDSVLRSVFDKYRFLPQSGLFDAMQYSLNAGGKRIRPILVLEFCRVCGGDPEKALPAACAIEMIHTYSLIHDDLPCMDNDDLRRGKPTNHKVYGEGIATIAGDALQAEAFVNILSSDMSPEAKLSCAEILAHACGAEGMCGGQYLDLLGEGKTLSAEQLNEINSRKTGAMLIAACKMGVAAAGGSERQSEAAELYGAAIGAAFQIRDDILDVISTEEELGKPIGSDEKQQKNTYMAAYGRDKCEAIIDELTENAANIIAETFDDGSYLIDLARSLAKRFN